MRLLPCLVTIAILLLAMPASAHHSRAHYSQETQEIQGELASISWTNPHAGFTLDVLNEFGEKETWRLESWSSPYILSRMGVTEEDFTVGRQVRVAGRISRRRTNDFLLTHLLREDGTEVVLAPNVEPFWGGEQLGGGSQWLDDEIQLQTTSDENRGTFRVWSVDVIYAVQQHYPFTQRAIETRAAWDELNSFVVTCEPRGMPLVMVNPLPIQFIDEGDRIVLRGQAYDFVRTIHMNAEAAPPELAPSQLGYSVGRWERNTLVVRTTNIDWAYFDTIGTPQSGAIEVTERFTLASDQASLNYHMTIVDPATFTEPATREQTLLALGETVEPFGCVRG